MDATHPIYLIALLPLLGAAINLIFGRKLSRGVVYTVAISAVAASFGVVAWLVAGPLWQHFAHGGGHGAALHQTLYTWIEVGNLKLDLGFQLDTLSAVMVTVVTFVGTLIHIYSTGYMADDPRYAAYFGYLNLFTASMLILVLADNLPVMFIGWEGVGVCSYLLIGFWFEKDANANAGRKAFVVNRIGDFAFILGMCLLFWATGTLDFADYQTAAAKDAFVEPFIGGERLAMWAGLFLFIGAAGKSAQIPLYVWLPDAMAGPTPVSALIHAATMVTAGVYMVARMSFLYASSTTAMAIVAGVGALTALFAAIMAFAQTDLKKVLAYSTVSQLGFMFVGVGVGAYVAGVFHLVTHAFFKAGLFLAAGSVMHAMSGSGDITKMGGLRKKLPITHAAFFVYCLAIAGIFPLSGFFSKDEILVGAFKAGGDGWWTYYGEFLWAVLSLAAAGTAFYMFRLYFLVFSGECRADEGTKAHIHESPASMTTPLVVLAAFTAVIGFLGLPHLHILEEMGLKNVLELWLHPALEHDVTMAKLSDGAMIGLMAAAMGIALVAIVLAGALYSKGPSDAVGRFTSTRLGARVHRVVAGKFYVDELYELVVLKPFRWVARALFAFVDRFVIDTVFVNGPARVVGIVAGGIRRVQNGQVQRYLAAFIVGGALIFFFASRPAVDFEYERTAARTAAFEAVVDAGPASVDAEIEWDFDGDGEADATGGDATWVFSQSGPHEVTMRFRDGVFGRWASVTETVHLHEEGTPSSAEGEHGDERGRSR